MCLGVYGRVLEAGDLAAKVDLGDGRAREMTVATADNLRRGDFVLVYAGTVVSKVSQASMLKSLRYLKEMAVEAAKEEGGSTREVRRKFSSRAKQLARPPR